MTIVVENGTGMANANSFVSVADADAFFTARNGSVWLGTENATKEEKLLEAAEYLNYSYRYYGARVKDDQAMAWPRYLVWDDDDRNVASDSVPQRVKDAQCLLALEALSGPLIAAEERAVASESVGPISVTYEGGSPQGKRFPRIDLILYDLIDRKLRGAVMMQAERA